MPASDTMMNVVRFHKKGPPDVLRYERVARPAPGPREALVELHMIGINYADIMRRKGENYPAPTPLPYTLGGEAVGIVVHVGEQGDPALLGQRVIIFPGEGCYADYAVVDQQRIYTFPSGITDEEAIALFVQGLSAALMLQHSARLAPGETVLVQGAAGGVGSIAVQLAKLQGAASVIGCAGSPAKRAQAEQLGADFTVDYGQPRWSETVRDYLQGRGVDIVLEMTGGDIARESYELLAPFGRSVVFGLTSEENWHLDTQSLPKRNLSVTGFWLRQYLDDQLLIIATLKELGDLVAAKRLRIQSGGRYRLSQAALAHAALESRSTSGKLVLIPDRHFR